jgi:hypothetical protein
MGTIEQVKQYKKLLKASEKAYIDIVKFKISLVGNCEHPDEFCHTYEEDNDDGYGKWWKTTLKKCICGKRWTKYPDGWREVDAVWPTKVHS